MYLFKRQMVLGSKPLFTLTLLVLCISTGERKGHLKYNFSHVFLCFPFDMVLLSFQKPFLRNWGVAQWYSTCLARVGL